MGPVVKRYSVSICFAIFDAVDTTAVECISVPVSVYRYPCMREREIAISGLPVCFELTFASNFVRSM